MLNSKLSNPKRNDPGRGGEEHGSDTAAKYNENCTLVSDDLQCWRDSQLISQFRKKYMYRPIS